MDAPSDSAELSLRGPSGQVVGTLRIVARSAMSLFVLTPDEASERGEEPVQIVEGRSYEYAFVSVFDSNLQVRESQAVQPSRLTPGTGRIEPGLATGLLPIVVNNTATEERYDLAVEVRSAKIDYQSDYRYMLDYIAELSIGLLLNVHAPSQARVTSDEHLEAGTLHERFAYLRYILDSQTFRESMSRILAMPHHLVEPTTISTPIQRGKATGHAVSKALRSTTARSRLPVGHPLYDRMIGMGVGVPTLPSWIEARRPDDRVDTPENRFVKYALGQFLGALMHIEQQLATNGTQADLRVLQEVLPLKRRLAEYLESDLLRQVNPATLLPLGSPVLQRRGGYRELLQAWLRFSFAVRLTWSGAQDVFGAGKKDVALLYEYWLYFVLLDVVAQNLNIGRSKIAQLLQPTSSGFDLRLKSGVAKSIRGVHEVNGKRLSVRFSYNRTFVGEPTNAGVTYPTGGSWTRAMRPDFSLSIWPEELSEDQAEVEESIIHIHFDAKYRVESIYGLFGMESEPGVDEDPLSARAEGRPVRSDLLKMHAYRDAIRRTEGAYVLYPGPLSGDHMWTEYHEIIPGLGAFAVRPGFETHAKESLGHFIRAVLTNASNIHSRSAEMRAAVRNIQGATP